MRMTKDSICEDCVHRGEVRTLRSYPKSTGYKHTEHSWCKEKVQVDDYDKVLVCSEFERIIKKVPPPNPRRFHTIP